MPEKRVFPFLEAVRMVMMKGYRINQTLMIIFFANVISSRRTTLSSAPTVTLLCLCHGIQGFVLFLSSTFTVSKLAKHLVAHDNTTRIDGLPRSDLLLALVFTCPAFNKLLFTLTDGSYFLNRTSLYVAVWPDCRLNHILSRAPARGPCACC